MIKTLLFEKKIVKVKKTIIVEQEESDQEFVRRINKTIAQEFRGRLNYCNAYTKSIQCDKCKMHLKETVKGLPLIKETNCAINVMKFMSAYIDSKL